MTGTHTDETMDRLAKEAANTAMIDALTASETSPDRPLLIADLVHYFTSNVPGEFDRIAEGLRKNPVLRSAFDAMAQKSQRAHLPAMAAASSGTLVKRSHSDFDLDWLPSRTRPDQAYLVLTLREAAGIGDGETPRLVLENQGELWPLTFPPVSDGKAQLLLLDDSPAMAMLRDKDTQLSLLGDPVASR